MTVSCDNRLMSRTTLSRELALLADAFGYRLADLRWFTLNAAKSAFYGYDERRALVEDVIKRASPRLLLRDASARRRRR